MPKRPSIAQAPKHVLGFPKPSESLFHEHWRRFFVLPQRSDKALAVASSALHGSEQLYWSLGMIPWISWRYPFQRAMLRRLAEHCKPRTAAWLYRLMHTALATTRGDYVSAPSEADKEALRATILAHCSVPMAQNMDALLRGVKAPAPILGSAPLESLWQRYSSERTRRCQASWARYYSFLLHYRVINDFLRTLFAFRNVAGRQKLIDKIVMHTLYAMRHASLTPPQVFGTQRIEADLENMSPAVYGFWQWQYTYRNSEYQTLRQPVEPFVRGTPLEFGTMPVTNINEYEVIYSRPANAPPMLGMFFPEYDIAINSTLERFGYLPAWPLTDYTPDFILRRMLTGTFNYWERETPQAHLDKAESFSGCLRTPELCQHPQRGTIPVMNGAAPVEVCAPECMVRMQEQECTALHGIIKEERARIRQEGIHRMIGLWLWDYCQGHGAKPADAIRALRDRHFPLKNPNWDHTKIPELASNPANSDWYAYRERTTDNPVLYADYQDACRCIAAAKVLPRERGTRKESNPLSRKDKTKK